jgi:hypothetical protein
MSKVAIQGNASGTGTFTIAAPNSNTDRTLTLPDEAGTVLTSASSITQNDLPLFRAYMSANQTVTNATETKVAFDTETIDVGNCYDTTNYRFLPSVAGYYWVNCTSKFGSNGGNYNQVSGYFYKNGALYSRFLTMNPDSSYHMVSSADLIYLNGSTDYVEVFTYITVSSGTPTVYGGDSTGGALFSGYLVKAGS